MLSSRAQPLTGPLVSHTYVARVVSAGGGVTEPAPNDPPAVIVARSVPRATGVPVTIFPQVSFTEPVRNVPGAVTLTDPQVDVGRNHGIRRICACSRHKHAKCPHVWYFNGLSLLTRGVEVSRDGDPGSCTASIGSRRTIRVMRS